MASSDTLSLFVPNPGDPPVEQITTSGAKVVTTSDGTSTIFPNDGDHSSRTSASRYPCLAITETTFDGPSKETSFIGNDA